MDGEQLKREAQALLEDDGLDHLVEPFSHCTLEVQDQEPGLGALEDGAGERPLFLVNIRGPEADCDLLRQHEITLINLLWRAGLRTDDGESPHVNLTFCGEGASEIDM
jgi:hypothetical protein